MREASGQHLVFVGDAVTVEIAERRDEGWMHEIEHSIDEMPASRGVDVRQKAGAVIGLPIVVLVHQTPHGALVRQPPQPRIAIAKRIDRPARLGDDGDRAIDLRSHGEIAEAMPLEIGQRAEGSLRSRVMEDHPLGWSRFLHVIPRFGLGSRLRNFRKFADTQIAPGNFKWPRPLVDPVELEGDVAARMGRVTFRGDGGDDHLLTVDPGGDLIPLREDTKLIPLTALEELVIAALVLGRQPLAPALAEDVAGKSSALRVLPGNVHLRPLERTRVLARKFPNPGADLDARIQLRIDQLDLELEIEVAVFLIRAKEGRSQAGRGRPDDGAVLHLEGTALVALGPAVEVLAVEQIGPFGLAEGSEGRQERREDAEVFDQ